MRRIVVLLFVVWPHAALAIVGGARPADDASARAVVTLVGSRGNFCSGALIAPDILLSAAHCVAGGAAAEFRIVTYHAQRQPTLLPVRRVATHPQFGAQAISAHRASADVALQLAQPLTSKPVAMISAPMQPLAAGAPFRVVGIGVTVRGDGRSGGITRSAALVATGKPGSLQIRLVDPTSNNTRAGLGACTGDSGAPVFEDQNGRSVIVGVVSWSTGANNTAGCGGLTGVTPLMLYKDWIVQTQNSWR